MFYGEVFKTLNKAKVKYVVGHATRELDLIVLLEPQKEKWTIVFSFVGKNMKRLKPSKKKKYEVWEHLEHTIRNTTYADRLLWLEQANEFVRRAYKGRKPFRSKTGQLLWPIPKS